MIFLTSQNAAHDNIVIAYRVPEGLHSPFLPRRPTVNPGGSVFFCPELLPKKKPATKGGKPVLIYKVMFLTL
jgi:hypothetical protein